jgi:hypothetical protein
VPVAARVAEFGWTIAASLTPLVEGLASAPSSPRATRLTLLRLNANALGTSLLSESLLLPAGLRGVFVQTLLYRGRLVRVAAASLTFNVGALVQRGRGCSDQGGKDGGQDSGR